MFPGMLSFLRFTVLQIPFQQKLTGYQFEHEKHNITSYYLWTCLAECFYVANKFCITFWTTYSKDQPQNSQHFEFKI